MWTNRVLAVCVCLLVVLVASASRAEQQPQAPVERWEYGELEFHTRLVGTAKGGVLQPTSMPARWYSAGGVIEGANWEDLAEKVKAPEVKLKAPEGKKADPSSPNRFRVLNFLGSQGWELISRDSPPDSRVVHHWTFKRKVTK